MARASWHKFAFAAAIGGVAIFPQSRALAGDSILVNGWNWCAKGVAATSCVSAGTPVPVYTADGNPNGEVDPGKVPVQGPHKLQSDYSIVEIGKGQWVNQALLSVTYCNVNAAMAVPGHPNRPAPAGMGSGAGCPQ